MLRPSLRRRHSLGTLPHPRYSSVPISRSEFTYTILSESACVSLGWLRDIRCASGCPSYSRWKKELKAGSNLSFWLRWSDSNSVYLVAVRSVSFSYRVCSFSRGVCLFSLGVG